MTAEVLRQAAALMRKRAHAATSSPWFDDDSTPSSCVYSPSADTFVTAPFDWDVNGTDTEHIASWHPAVALAVADLLEKQATFSESMPGFDIEELGDASALAVARAYLGEPAR